MIHLQLLYEVGTDLKSLKIFSQKEIDFQRQEKLFEHSPQYSHLYLSIRWSNQAGSWSICTASMKHIHERLMVSTFKIYFCLLEEDVLSHYIYLPPSSYFKNNKIDSQTLPELQQLHCTLYFLQPTVDKKKNKQLCSEITLILHVYTEEYF